MYSTLLYFYCNLIAPVLLSRVKYDYITVFQPHTNNNTKAFTHSSNNVIYRVTHSGWDPAFSQYRMENYRDKYL